MADEKTPEWYERKIAALERRVKNAESVQHMYGRSVLRVEAENARLRLQLAELNHKMLTDSAWLKGKVVRQRERIKALENAEKVAEIKSEEG